MDFVNGGELFQHLKKSGPFSEDKSRFYIAEIFLAIESLHERNIVYRDLKPENILLDNEGHVKLTDFGLAKSLSADDKASTMCGTPEYFAPEILLKIGYDRMVDYWTLGVLLYELITMNTPFRADNSFQIF